MSVKFLSEHHLEFLSLKRGYTGSSDATLLEITCHDHVMTIVTALIIIISAVKMVLLFCKADYANIHDKIVNFEILVITALTFFLLVCNNLLKIQVNLKILNCELTPLSPLYLLVLSADNLCKRVWAQIRPDKTSKLCETLMVFLKEFTFKNELICMKMTCLITLVNVYVDLLVFTHIAGTS